MQSKRWPDLPVEQNARAALGIADYGYVLENGRVSWKVRLRS